MEHTPGPWKLSFEDYGDEHWFGGKGEGQYIICGNCDLDDTEGTIVCGPLYRENTPSKAAECTANARLIAVAPKLLEVLEDYAGAYHDQVCNPSKFLRECDNYRCIEVQALIREAKEE